MFAPHLTGRDVCKILQGYGRMKRNDPKVLRDLEPVILKHINSFTVPQISLVLYSMRQLMYKNTQIVDLLFRQLCLPDMIPLWDGLSVAMACSTSGTFNLYHVHFWNYVTEKLQGGVDFLPEPVYSKPTEVESYCSDGSSESIDPLCVNSPLDDFITRDNTPEGAVQMISHYPTMKIPSQGNHTPDHFDENVMVRRFPLMNSSLTNGGNPLHNTLTSVKPVYLAMILNAMAKLDIRHPASLNVISRIFSRLFCISHTVLSKGFLSVGLSRTDVHSNSIRQERHPESQVLPPELVTEVLHSFAKLNWKSRSLRNQADRLMIYIMNETLYSVGSAVFETTRDGSGKVYVEASENGWRGKQRMQFDIFSLSLIAHSYVSLSNAIPSTAFLVKLFTLIHRSRIFRDSLDVPGVRKKLQRTRICDALCIIRNSHPVVYKDLSSVYPIELLSTQMNSSKCQIGNHLHSEEKNKIDVDLPIEFSDTISTDNIVLDRKKVMESQYFTPSGAHMECIRDIEDWEMRLAGDVNGQTCSSTGHAHVNLKNWRDRIGFDRVPIARAHHSRWAQEVKCLLRDHMRVKLLDKAFNQNSAYFIIKTTGQSGDLPLVAVICTGPFAYYVDTTIRTSTSLHLQRMLTINGYSVMHIAYFEWRELKTVDDKLLYLYSKGRQIYRDTKDATRVANDTNDSSEEDGNMHEDEYGEIEETSSFQELSDVIHGIQGC